MCVTACFLYPGVLSRIAQTTAALTKLKVIWNDNNVTISFKIRLMRSLVMSIFLYACEMWTLTADIERRMQAMEMRCFHKLLDISYRDHITNKEMKTRIENTIGSHEDLLTSVKRCKLRRYRHITRSAELAKTILDSSPRREVKRQTEKTMGRQHQRVDWPGMEHHTAES